MGINLSLFTDGVNIKKSTFKKELWPVWLQISDLPPKLRMARKNFLLAALFVGPKQPNWEIIASEVRAELLTPIELDCESGRSVTVDFNARPLVCDLSAKSHLLNMYKFNGFYGCHYCTVQGKTIG